MSKDDIIEQLRTVTQEFASFCSTIDEENFFKQPREKWSIAQNIKHLITSANSTRLAYRLPKIVLRLYVGKPNRASRTYEELVNKYKLRLQQGGKASGQFIPEKIDAKSGSKYWLEQFNRSMLRLISTIDDKWKDAQLDQYIVPHPLIGKITHRELGYFTIYHIPHHLQIIKDRLT